MKKIYTLFFGLIFSLTVSAQCTELFISEYAEGSSNNKYLEVFNPTDASVDLSDYALIRNNNGGTTSPDTFFFNGTLDAKDVYVIANASADSIILSYADTTGTATYYNGDDALSLLKISTSTLVDNIGVLGVDPGSGWAVGTGFTNEHTLVRKSSVDAGQTDWALGAAEWDVYAQNTWDYAGSHRSICTGIQNAGYDIEGDDSYRDFWRNRDFEDQLPNTNLLQITSSPVHMGVKAGKFPSSGDRIAYQAVVVKPMTNYIIKFWYTMKTNNTGSATVTILEGDIRDTINVTGATIASVTVNDQTDANTYVQDSIEFTSGASDIAAIYLTNEGEEFRFDSWDIEEAQATVVAAIQNPGFDIEGDDSYRNFWRNSAFEDSASSSAMIQITSGPTHNGSAKAAKLPSDGSRAGYQAVDVNPNTDYIVTYWYTMKTSPAGSANVAILGMDLVDPALVAANTIASSTVIDQTDANTYIKDSVAFNSGSSSQIAIYFTNTGVESRFDSWNIYEGTVVVAEPTAAAPDPTADAVDVISIYSQSYTDPAGINYFPNWGQSTQYSVFEIGTDSMIKYSALNYQGVDFNASQIDASSMEMLHIDIWTADVDSVLIFPISRTTGEKSVNNVLTPGQWNSIDILLSDFTSQGLSMSDIFQFKFDNLGLSRSAGTIFIDNMYLWKEPTLVYNVADIADVIMLDADLAATNEDALYELTGVVYGVDLDGNAGISFTIIDETAGINIFNYNDVDDYVVTEGDEITVKGKIDFYNGLLELFADSILVNSSGNTLKSATQVEAPSEATESDFIVLRKVWITNDTTTMWPNNGNVELTNDDMDTFQIRIDKDIPGIVGMPVEFDTMTITGLGGQYDGSAPYNEGYQIFPRGLSDIAEYVDRSSVRESVIKTRVYPNPTSNNLTVIGTQKWDTYKVFNILGGIV
ncbi:lamin tail domain-containing protein, partial [Bacteroidia bacterium]|nr:lamin tail domain-containing protein [Bacteroidia bacterium]